MERDTSIVNFPRSRNQSRIHWIEQAAGAKQGGHRNPSRPSWLEAWNQAPLKNKLLFIVCSIVLLVGIWAWWWYLDGGRAMWGPRPSHPSQVQKSTVIPSVSHATEAPQTLQKSEPIKPAPTLQLTAPKFLIEQDLNKIRAPKMASQNAARFAWLDSLSGPNLNKQSVLAQIQRVTTPNLYEQLASSFSPPQDKQTWVDVKVYPVQKEQDGSWLLNTIAEAKDSMGHEQQLHLYETMVQEGVTGTWLVQQVAYDPPTS